MRTLGKDILLLTAQLAEAVNKKTETPAMSTDIPPEYLPSFQELQKTYIEVIDKLKAKPVSYTHLTLPTI